MITEAQISMLATLKGSNVDNAQILEEILTLVQDPLYLIPNSVSVICQLITPTLHSSLLKRLNLLLSDINMVTASTLQIALTTRLVHPEFECNVLDNLIKNCMMVAIESRKETACLELLFSYLHKTEQVLVFWSNLVQRPHLDPLVVSDILLESIGKVGIHQSYFEPQIINILVGILRKKGKDITSKKKTEKTLSALLQWKPETTNLSPDERTVCIKLLFKEKTNVLHAYKELSAGLRQFLTYLGSEELYLIGETILTQLEALKLENMRHTEISKINFITRIAQNKGSSKNIKMSIVMFLFHLGFCTSPPASDENTWEIIIQTARDSLQSVLRARPNFILVDDTFDGIAAIMKGDSDAEYSLVTCLDAKTSKLWKSLKKQVRNIEDETMLFCLKTFAIELVIKPSKSSEIIKDFIELCKEITTEEQSDKILAMVKFFHEHDFANNTLLAYDNFFKGLLMKGLIDESCIEYLANTLEMEVSKHVGAQDGTNVTNDDDSEEEENFSDAENVDPVTEDGENEFSYLSQSTLDSTTEKDDSDESINLDEADPKDLEEMDFALSQIVAMKKRKKEDSPIKDLFHVLELLQDLVKRFKSPHAHVPLLIIMPCLRCLIQCSKKKRLSDLLSKIMKVVMGLNKLKKVEQLETVERTVVEGVVADINLMLEKKLPKDVRIMISKNLEMIKRCYNVDEQKTKKKRKKSLSTEVVPKKKVRTTRKV